MRERSKFPWYKLFPERDTSTSFKKWFPESWNWPSWRTSTGVRRLLKIFISPQSLVTYNLLRRPMEWNFRLQTANYSTLVGNGDNIMRIVMRSERNISWWKDYAIIKYLFSFLYTSCLPFSNLAVSFSCPGLSFSSLGWQLSSHS